MNKRTILWVVTAAVLIACGILLASPKKESPHVPAVTQQSAEISVSVPAANALVSSPVAISGTVRANWFFEAVFPITIVDWDGRIIGEGHAQTSEDWMTSGPVPFTASITFQAPQCGTGQDYCHRGAIIFKNDNPSGDPAHSKSFELPVIFK